MAGRHMASGRPAKGNEDGVRYVIEFADGSTKRYTSGQARYQAFKQLKEQGKEYLVKRQYMTGTGLYNTRVV